MFETLEQFDRALFLNINLLHSPAFDSLMWVLSQSWHSYLLVGIICFLVYKRYDAKKAAEFVLGCALVIACTDFSSNAVKHGIKRYRPTHNLEIKQQVHTVNNYTGGQYGFFSGHAANSFGITLFILMCLQWVKARLKWLLLIYPILICYSRVYLGVHYPSDILVGALDGLFFGYLLYYMMNTYFFKFSDETKN